MMNHLPETVKRGEHRIPRWINLLWLAIIVGLALASIVLAIQLCFDIEEIVGFLFVSFIVIFFVALIVGLALYGLSIVLEGVEYHKTHCDDSKHYAGLLDFMR
jgi:ABC-type uncharacterized transport system permease subunit